MGCDELIESLRKEADAKIRQIWKEAEEEAGVIRADLSRGLEAMKQEGPYGQPLKNDVVNILLEAESRARIIKLEYEDRFSARLYSLAASCLGFLRDENYAEIFGRLTLDLPSYEWGKVTVNPRDSGLAKEYYPEAEIAADSDIAGGMAVENKGGDVKVINTFEKRLERSWPQMLPDLLGDIRRETMDNGTPR